jgi:predicted phage gp36 major capsid-like protein
MHGEGPGMDGKPTKYTIVSKMPDDNTMNFAMYMGDVKEPAFTILYKRKK